MLQLALPALFLISASAARIRIRGGGRSGKGCSYTELTTAHSEYAHGADLVEVEVCGRWRRLSGEVQRPETFEEVVWWSPSTEEMTTCEEQKIIDYTGHFWYSRNIGRLFKGTAPQLQIEDPEGKWESQSHPELVQEVLKFSVEMGKALNKLPVPPERVDLFRSSWVAKDVLVSMMKLPKRMRLPWFQSTSSDETHTFMFFRRDYAPNYCKALPGGCLGQGAAFPVHYKYHTTHAKDVTKWNDAEKEHILLPNVPFDVVSVKYMLNDPFYEMPANDPEPLAKWFEKEHDMPDWVQAQWSVSKQGPWPDWATAVRRKKMDGPTFAGIYEEKLVYGVQKALRLGNTDPYKALQARFALPPLKGIAPDYNPYYYEVVMEDSDSPELEELVHSGPSVVHWVYYGVCYWTDKCAIETLVETNARVFGKVFFEHGPCPDHAATVLEAGERVCHSYHE